MSLRIHKGLIRFCMGIVLFALLVNCGGESKGVNKHEPVPSFVLQRLDADPMVFPKDLPDRPIMLLFWADWCSACKTEMRQAEMLYQKYQHKGLEVLAINIGQDRQTARRFISDLTISYDVLLDSDSEVADRYKVQGLPTTLFINREGQLHTKILGESTIQVFEKVLNQFL